MPSSSTTYDSTLIATPAQEPLLGQKLYEDGWIAGSSPAMTT
jgi:hypothetical protein